jgi:hypothetical protein
VRSSTVVDCCCIIENPLATDNVYHEHLKYEADNGHYLFELMLVGAAKLANDMSDKNNKMGKEHKEVHF